MQPPQAPGSYPLVGHTPHLLRTPLDSLQRWGHGDDDIVCLRIAGQSVCLVTAPDAIKQVLVTDADQYQKAQIVRDRLGSLQGGSLVLLEGEQWRERRQLLQSGFGASQVKQAGSLTTTDTTEMVDSWPEGEPIRADEQLQTLSLAILARALFGLELHGERTPIHEAADDILARMALNAPSAYLPEWVPTPRNYRFQQAVETLHERLDAIVADSSGSQQNGNLLSIMQAGGLDPETIRDELIALLFAGYDSTATALSLTLGLLGDHPEIQASLRDELETLDGETPTPADLDDLPLLDAVVRESLRLYPPQYVLFREPTETVTLGEYRIDAETMVVLPPWVTQRDPSYWDDPTQFRPRRWLEDKDESNPDRPEFAYFPYGGGGRYCLGARLAAQTIRLVVATVCQRRQLQSQEPVSVSAGPTLSAGEVLLRTFDDPV